MMNRRTLAMVVAVACAVSMLMGAAPAQAQKKITVLTWNISYITDTFKKWEAAFKKIYPDVTVEWIDKKGTEWSTYYQTQVVAGTPPDVIDVQGGLWLEYASKGGLVDITPFLQKDKAYTERFYPEFLKSWIFEGKNYGVPFYISKTLLFYNMNMIKEAGLTIPPKSFDELISFAYKMTKGEKSGFMTVNFDWLYWPLFAMNGVELLTPDLKKAAFNTPAAVKTLETLSKATADGAINKISWTGRWVEPNGAFAAGTVGIHHAHSPAFLWFKSQGPWVNKDTVAAGHLPGGWSTPNSHALLVSKGSKYPEIAWDFVKTVSVGDMAFEFGTAMNVLSGDKLANEKLFDHFGKNLPELVPVLKTQLEHLDKLVGNWPAAKDAEIKEAFYPEIQNALLGRKGAKEALAEAETKVNRVLQRR